MSSGGGYRTVCGPTWPWPRWSKGCGSDSVGFKGDSYDNAAAESLNGLYKTELIRCRGPWRSLEDVEFATMEWVDWYNHHRLHSWCGDIPPVEHEALYYRQNTDTDTPASAEPSLH